MTTTYTLVADQTEKKELDNVEVNIRKEEVVISTEAKTAGQLKAEIAKLDTKLTVVAEEKAKLEAELAEILTEAEKFELKVDEPVEEPIK